MLKQSIIFKGYKCFGNTDNTEIRDFKLFNVFIGKNNSGKSSALDVMCYIMGDKSSRALKIDPLYLDFEFDDDFINEYSKKNLEFVYHCRKKNLDNRFTVYFDSYRRYETTKETQSKYGQHVFGLLKEMPRYYYTCRLISAERNIYKETESRSLELSPTGEGATNLIRAFLYQQDLPEKLIEKDLLDALNTIMYPDACFESIRVQHSVPSKNEDSKVLWEVYLQEKGGNRLPLSQVGSGLKTIILVLLNLIVIPHTHSGENLAFAFEELENNLHPALQRKLLEYIYDYAIEHNCYVFLTTHSHSAINMIFDKPQASIYHVTKENQTSFISKIDNYSDRIALLDDLNIKASDLLQANGLIWVEGPSDRIYIKKWLEVFCGNEIQEGRDYQFLYYGGRLISHYKADYSPIQENELIDLLLVNRNSAIVMDSDKRFKSAPIGDTKKRIQEEFNDKDLFSWITKGKEIENYISLSAIQKSLELSPEKQCEKYELFPKYIGKYYKNFSGKKVAFANLIKENITAENVLDLEFQIKKLYNTIKSWNK